jgi:hypothetical protein
MKLLPRNLEEIRYNKPYKNKKKGELKIIGGFIHFYSEIPKEK